VSSPLALVTGASGFVGSHIVDELLRQGVRVRCVVRGTSPRRWLDGKPVEIHVADLADLPGLTAAAEGATWIVHAAGLTKGRSATAFNEANVAGTERMLRAALEAGPSLRRFVLISSQAAAGPSGDGRAVTEERRPEPVTPYGESKLRSEELALLLRDRLPVVVLRPPAVYGPRDEGILRYFRAAKRHVRLELRRGGRFSVIHAEDLARAVWLAMSDERARGEVFFVAGPDVTGYAEMGGLIARSLGTWTVPLSPPRWLLLAGAFVGDAMAGALGGIAFLNSQKIREITSGDWICSSARFRIRLGWEPRWSLEEGVEQTARWYREAGWL
jgi:nucleoside-diphosphate-sugar epimerase